MVRNSCFAALILLLTATGCRSCRKADAPAEAAEGQEGSADPSKGSSSAQDPAREPIAGALGRDGADPRITPAYRAELARVHMRYASFNRAEREVRAAIDESTSPMEKKQLYALLAEVQWSLGKKEAAAGALDEAIATGPKDEESSPAFLLRLGRARLDMGKADEAEKIFTQVFQQTKEGPERDGIRDDILRAWGEQNVLLQRLDELKKAAPKDIDKVRMLARAYSGIQQVPAEAIKYYEVLVKSADKDRSVAYGLADAYRRAGRFDEAAETFKKMAKTFPDDRALAYSYVSETYSAKGDKVQAIAWADKMVEAAPYDRHLKIRHADILLSLGETDKAIEAFTKLLDSAQDELEQEELRFLLAGAHVKKGERDKARAILYKIVDVPVGSGARDRARMELNELDIEDRKAGRPMAAPPSAMAPQAAGEAIVGDRAASPEPEAPEPEEESEEAVGAAAPAQTGAAAPDDPETEEETPR